MASAVLSLASSLNCPHGGAALPTVVARGVYVGGSPALAQGGVAVVVQCHEADACLTAVFSVGAGRVRASGHPLLLEDSPSECFPGAVALRVRAVSGRVRAM